MTAPRVVVETPRPEPCPEAGCVIPHMDRRVLQAGEYVLIEKVDGEWPAGNQFAAIASWFYYWQDWADMLNDLSAVVADGQSRAEAERLDALAGGSP